jgi:hypothetical protein
MILLFSELQSGEELSFERVLQKDNKSKRQENEILRILFFFSFPFVVQSRELGARAQGPLPSGPSASREVQY